MSDTDIKASILPDNAITELSKKAYDDIAHKPLAQVGEIGESLMKLVSLPFKCMGMTMDELEKKYRIFITKTINKVPEEKRVEPSPAVVGPILDHVKYVFNEDILIKMFSELLSSAINSDTRDKVHPSFVDNLKRMSPYEAQIINYLSVNDYIISSNISTVCCLETSQIGNFTDNLIQLFSCSCPFITSSERASFSFNFLKSLGIVNINSTTVDLKEYRSLLKGFCNTYNPPHSTLLAKLFNIDIPLHKGPCIYVENLDYSFIRMELNENFGKAFQSAVSILDEDDTLFTYREYVNLTQYGSTFMNLCTKKEHQKK